MSVSLRRIARSRGLRALGVLAWLMLALGALTTTPPGAAGLDRGAMHATMAQAGESAAHARMHHSAACCDLQGHCGGTTIDHGCACQGLCTYALPMPSADLIAPAPVAVAHARSNRERMPAPETVPPLRPPLA